MRTFKLTKEVVQLKLSQIVKGMYDPDFLLLLMATDPGKREGGHISYSFKLRTTVFGDLNVVYRVRTIASNQTVKSAKPQIFLSLSTRQKEQIERAGIKLEVDEVHSYSMLVRLTSELVEAIESVPNRGT